MRFIFSVVLFLAAATLGLAQTPSTSSASPPLQWINLGQFASGTTPNAVRDALIGYDYTSSTLLVFGGQSSSGDVTSDTYILDLQTLTWSKPNPPAGVGSTPPARSLAIGGGDYASNYRNDFAMYGGRDSQGNALGDFWSYDYAYKFWSPGSLDTSEADPGPRYGASGGLAPQPLDNQALTTTLLVAGGSNGSTTFEDVYELVISGTLSTNNPQDVSGKWTKLSPGNAGTAAGPLKAGQASTVLAGSTMVVFGGCNVTASDMNNATCAQNDVHWLSFPSANTTATPAWTSGNDCTSGRYGATMVPNLNTASTSFTTQVFMMLGAVDSTKWNDQNGTSLGEVDIFDVSVGTWARIIPSGTPPTPRMGAVAVSYSGPMSGNSSVSASDTLIFGGVEVATGNYLNDLWLLRAYNGVITGSGQHWSGYGNGQLQNSATANGQGVTNQYLSQCAVAIQPAATTATTTTTTTSSSSATSTSSTTTLPTPSSTTAPSIVYAYDTSAAHKTLSALSIVLFLPALLLFRFSSGPPTSRPEIRLASIYLAGLMGLVGYAMGVAGFAMGLNCTVRTTTLVSRSNLQTTFLKTSHGQAGFALFICLYVLVPIWAACSYCARRYRRAPDRDGHSRNASQDVHLSEKLKDPSASSSPGFDSEIQRRYTEASETAEERDEFPPKNSRRTSSPAIVGGKLSEWAGHQRRRMSESALVSPISSAQTEPATRPALSAGSSFEVVNRPRRVSGPSGRLMPNDHHRHYARGPARSLSDFSWMDRRGRVGDIAELDLAMSSRRALSHSTGPDPVTPGTAEYHGSPDPLYPSAQSLPQSNARPPPRTRFPSVVHILFRLFLFVSLTFACVLTLIALRDRAPFGTFIAFLIWSVLFYALVAALAWFGRPSKSSLAVIFNRLRADDPVPPSQHAPLPLQSPELAQAPPSRTPSGSGGLGPYTYHQPPYHRANSHEEDAFSHHPMSIESEEVDQDEDDEQRQRQMEAEMASRDVVVMTVPRRALKIVNM